MSHKPSKWMVQPPLTIHSNLWRGMGEGDVYPLFGGAYGVLGRHGTPQGAIELSAPGIGGKGVEFTGGNRIELPDSVGDCLEFSGTAAFVWTHDGSTGSGQLLETRAGGGNGWDVDIGVTASSLSFRIDTGGATVLSVNIAAAGVELMVAVARYDGATAYLDVRNYGSTSTAKTGNATRSATTKIGNNNSNAQPLGSGRILHSAVISQRAWDDREVQQFFDSPFAIITPRADLLLAPIDAELQSGTTDGAGSAALVFGASGVGASTAAAAGSASLTFAAAGAGASTYAGDGAASIVFGATAAGASIFAADGAASLVFGASGVGDALSSESGTGAAAVTFSVSGVGESTAAAAGAAAITFADAAVGAAINAAAGSSAVVFGVTGDGAATGAGAAAGAITFGAAGVGDSAAGSGAGAAAIAFSAAGVGAATVASAGAGTVIFTVSGVGQEVTSTSGITNALLEIVEAVVTKLRADAGVKAIVGSRVHKALPVRPTFPCVTVFMPTSGPWDTKDAQGTEATIQIDCWSRDDRDQDTLRSLQKAVADALHEATLALASENHVLTREISSFAMTDPDASTIHGVQNYRVLAHA